MLKGFASTRIQKQHLHEQKSCFKKEKIWKVFEENQADFAREKKLVREEDMSNCFGSSPTNY